MTDLRVGDLVDLASCPYLNIHPTAQTTYAEVTAVTLESRECVVVSYRDIDRVGYHPGIVLQVAERQPAPDRHGFDFLYLNPAVLQSGDHLLLPSGRLEKVISTSKHPGSSLITIVVSEGSGKRRTEKTLRRERPVLAAKAQATPLTSPWSECAVDFLAASEEAAWRECGATEPENAMIASLGGYRAIMACPDKQQRCADTLAALLANRVIDVSQHLGSQAWTSHDATSCTFQVRTGGDDACVIVYEGRCAHTPHASGRAMHIIHRLSVVEENRAIPLAYTQAMRWSSVPDLLDCCAHEMSERIHDAALLLAVEKPRQAQGRQEQVLLERGASDDLIAHL
ncbi:MAG: hypothetical protein ACYDDA_07965 [Acidiferrobacteraceae bacterium]